MNSVETASDPGSSPQPRRHGGIAWIAGVYAALVLFMTMPLPLHMIGRLPAGAVDLWQNYWNFWWWKKCLFELHQSPYSTGFLFFPTGADLSFYTHSPFNMIASMPVNLIAGPAAAYNFCVLLALWLSALFMFLLAREATGDSRGAFLAGLVYAFFPNHMEQTLEHLNLFSIQFIPLSVFFLLRIVRRGGWGAWTGLGGAYALNALCSWDLAILLTLTLLPVAAVEAARSPRIRLHILRDLALAAGLAAVIILPFAWPLLKAMASGANFFQKAQQNRGIDALYLFLPSGHHPFLGWLTESFYIRRAYEAAGFTCFLGFVPLAGALLALARRAPGRWLWGGILGASLVLALGAHPWWNGRLVDSITLPFALFEKLPLMSLVRIANRFMIFAGLALAMLASAAAAHLPVRRRGMRVLALLVLLEYLWLPYPTQESAQPGFYARIAGERGGAVLHLPFTGNGQTVGNMRAQVAHGRPIAGGYSSTPPPDALRFIAEDPVLSDLVGDSAMARDKAPSVAPTLAKPLDVAHLRSLGFEWVILDKTRSDAFAEAARSEVALADHQRRNPGVFGPEIAALAGLAAPNIYERKLLSRHGGITREKFDRLRAELDRALGDPEHEDALIAAWRVTKP